MPRVALDEHRNEHPQGEVAGGDGWGQPERVAGEGVPVGGGLVDAVRPIRVAHADGDREEGFRRFVGGFHRGETSRGRGGKGETGAHGL